MKKEQIIIPAGKVKRAAKFITTGAKVGSNYVKHYTKKAFTGGRDETELHLNNAEDIYDSLSELKGSVLKVAQMMSMDKQALPNEYLRKFSEAQYQTPPLSFPLVVRTFKKNFGCSPLHFFDKFEKEAINAASMGQVHRAEKNGRLLAVKIQYPGVAQSVSSDLKMAYPLAKVLLKMNTRDIRQYMEEVEERLLEETDYELELARSMDLSQKCRHLEGITFPTYYPEMSNKRILTMDWMEGMHLPEFLETKPSQKIRNNVGQALWNFYQYQIHTLQSLHADPHPGNFIIKGDGTLGVIDFGCVKILPDDFYKSYFKLLDPNLIEDSKLREQLFLELGFLYADDEPKDKVYFDKVFTNSIKLLGKPFYNDRFDFSNPGYFEEIYRMGRALTKAPQMRQSKHGRGSKHGLYLNRTYFGLYNLLHHLGATVDTMRFNPEFV